MQYKVTGRETALKGLGVLLVWVGFFDNGADSPTDFVGVQGCPALELGGPR